MLIGLCAAGVGIATGWLLAPLIDGPGAGLLGAPSAPTLTGTTIGVVVALSLAVAIMATFVPAVRAARQSTLTSLNNSARPPRRNVALTALSAHLPPTLLLGVRLVARRPRRLVLSVFSVAVTTSGLVAVMIVQKRSAIWSLGPQVARATSIITIMLIVLAAVNAVFIAWTTALETRAPTTLARALGATPGQITAGPALAFLPPALLGAMLGIAGGIGIFDAARNGPGHTTLPSDDVTRCHGRLDRNCGRHPHLHPNPHQRPTTRRRHDPRSHGLSTLRILHPSRTSGSALDQRRSSGPDRPRIGVRCWATL